MSPLLFNLSTPWSNFRIIPDAIVGKHAYQTRVCSWGVPLAIMNAIYIQSHGAAMLPPLPRLPRIVSDISTRGYFVTLYILYSPITLKCACIGTPFCSRKLYRFSPWAQCFYPQAQHPMEYFYCSKTFPPLWDSSLSDPWAHGEPRDLLMISTPLYFLEHLMSGNSLI